MFPTHTDMHRGKHTAALQPSVGGGGEGGDTVCVLIAHTIESEQEQAWPKCSMKGKQLV